MSQLRLVKSPPATESALASRRRAQWGVAIGALVIAIVAGAGIMFVGGLGSGASVTPVTDDEDAALDSSRVFLDTYLGDDGRVSRADEGGSTVSEGQAYAMLLAVAIGDRDAFDSAWGWTEDNLQRPDGLLAAQWESGSVTDDSPAADADLDAARALVLAADRFDDPSLRDDALRIAAAILEHETAVVNGQTVLTAGDWAREPPPTVNPSYLDPRAFAILGAASGDPRWKELEGSSRELLETLLAASPLPPDWARVEPAGPVAAPAPAEPAGMPRYGFDAFRMPIRWAAACTAENRSLAATPWSTLGPQVDAGSLGGEYSLDGAAISAANPVAQVAAAASARAAGDTDASDQLLAQATEAEAAAPSYYGAAWVALGRVMLTTEWLGPC